MKRFDPADLTDAELQELLELAYGHADTTAGMEEHERYEAAGLRLEQILEAKDLNSASAPNPVKATMHALMPDLLVIARRNLRAAEASGHPSVDKWRAQVARLEGNLAREGRLPPASEGASQ